MIASRVHRRRKTKTVDVIGRTYSSVTGSYADTTVYNDLSPAYEQENASDLSDDWGQSQMVIDVFWFERADGVLPVILPRHFIAEGANRYEVMDVTDQGGSGNRLKVRCRRYAHPGD